MQPLHQPTHIAWADETNYNRGQYRGISLVSTTIEYTPVLNTTLTHILQEAGVSELKWARLNREKYRKAALNMVEYAVEQAEQGNIRIDTLLWDTEDSRHKIPGRDDKENLHRMYHHIVRNVLEFRWSHNSTWLLYPDEQTAIRWTEVHDFLQKAAIKKCRHQSPLDRLEHHLMQTYRIKQIIQCDSGAVPMVQLADLFAGLGVFSRSSYAAYHEWSRFNCEQHPRDLCDAETKTTATRTYSHSQRERFPVLATLHARCREHKLTVSLDTDGMLRTRNPNKPINFWWYAPQRADDKAPLRQHVCNAGQQKLKHHRGKNKQDVPNVFPCL